MWRITEIQAILDDAWEAIRDGDGDASLRLCWQALSGILDDEDIDPVLQDEALDYRREIEDILSLSN